MSNIELAVVQVLADKVAPSFSRPWMHTKRFRTTGSGFCIESDGKKYILTNAHCVSNAVHITLRKRGTARLYIARVAAILYECDLAALELEVDKKGSDKIMKEFWSDLPALPIGSMPAKLDKVYVYGYPLGGYNISITKGVVNRVQVITYFGVVNHIAIQIDAPINFGNSGGPVVDTNGEVVGVAFSGEDDSVTQNMGYIIPTVLIRFFLRVLHEGNHFTGLCSLGIDAQQLANTSLREYVAMSSKDTGVLILKVDENGSSHNILKPMDVLMTVNGKNIDNDGTMSLYDVVQTVESKKTGNALLSNEIVSFHNLISLQRPGDKVKLGIIRDGKKQEVEVKLKPVHRLVSLLEYQCPPSYYIVAGLVFLPLTVNVILEKRESREFVNHLLASAEDEKTTKNNEQIIILSEIFSHDITADYHASNNILLSVNDIPINNLVHLHDTVTTLLKKEDYLVFRFKDVSHVFIFDTKKVNKVNKSILLENLGHTTDFVVAAP